jgi:hypothetical protein
MRLGLTTQWLVLLGAAALAGFTLTASCSGPASPAKEGPQEDAADDETRPAPPVAAFKDEGYGKYGFINRRGAVVLEPKYESADDFVDGLARVRSDGKLGFIDATGKLRFTLPPGTQEALDASEGMVWFRSPRGGRWGFCDDKGRVILESAYDDVEPFSDGLAAVNLGAKVQAPLGDTSGGKWGYVDKKGKLVIPVQYEHARPFSDGLAQVSDSAGAKLLDNSGKVVVDLGQVIPGDFREGLAPVYVGPAVAGKDWHTRFLDRRGKPAFTVEGWAEEFHEGMAVVSVKGGEAESINHTSYGYVDRAGKLVIRPRFGEAHAFSEGLAAVRTKKTTGLRIGDTWGYIDKTGKYRIEPLFNEARPFRGGVARVHIGGKMPVARDVPPYWVGGEWWFIDRTGKKLKRS